MASTWQHITKHLIEKSSSPVRGQLFIRDDELTGFAVRITPNGSKSFVWEGRVNGRTQRDILGRFPESRRRNHELGT